MTSPRDTPEPLLSARDLAHHFKVRARDQTADGLLHVLSGVSFDVRAGETLGIVGESGSGKTTLARALLQIPPPSSGAVIFRGTDLTRVRGRALQDQRAMMQMIFQDPFRSLNPTWRVSSIVEEPLAGARSGTAAERRRRVGEVLEQVGLPESTYGHRRAHQLSGGQCQRVAIARALTLRPALLISDEALSALDVLIQAQLLDLFLELKNVLGLAHVFISHDLALVRQISDRVAVLHLGQLCEIGPAASLFDAPRHPYTSMLVDAIPRGPRSTVVANASLQALSQEPPSPMDPPSGCRFRTRCPHAQARCAVEVPQLEHAGGDHLVACHYPFPLPVASPEARAL